MKVQIDTQPLSSGRYFAASESRARQLLKTFISETYVEELLKHPEIQRSFMHWLENRETYAGHRTIREEIKSLHRAAKEPSAPLPLIESMAEEKLNNTRNNIANVSEKIAISRVFTQQLLQQMQEVLQSGGANITPTQREAFIVFSASLMTGARPSEWHEAVLYDARQNPNLVSNEATLWLHTAKSRNTDERQRNLILRDFTNTDLGIVKSAADIGHARTPAQLAQFSTAVRKLALKVADTDEKVDALSRLELNSARKLYAVEAMRSGYPKEEVAAVLGHTTTNNLRWYIQGDTDGPRQCSYPLAEADEQATMGIRDPLENLLNRKDDQPEQQDNDQTSIR